MPYIKNTKSIAYSKVCVTNFATVLDVSIVNGINNYWNFHQRRKFDMENTVCQLRLSKTSEIPEGLCEP